MLTIPAASLLGSVAYEISTRFGPHNNTGSIVIASLAALAAFVLFRLAQRDNVRPEDLDRTKLATGAEDVAEAETAGEIWAKAA
jgi:hypothetical protein